MINVPATKAGIPVIEALTAEGINVNATLIFSVARCEAVAGAYIAGIEKLAAAGGAVGIYFGTRPQETEIPGTTLGVLNFSR